MEPKWYFSKEEVCNSRNRRRFENPSEELSWRIKATTFLQLIGHKLKLSTNCVGIALVYLHRFYMFLTFDDVNEKKLAMVALFLSCKAQNEFRKLEHIMKVAYAFMDSCYNNMDVKSEFYLSERYYLIGLENVLLQVLGFEVDVELPHPYVIKTCQLISGSKELVKQSYFLATSSLTATTMCLQYKPMTVACVCINLSARWFRFQIDSGAEKRPWYFFVAASLTAKCLTELTDELEKAILTGAKELNSPVLINVLKGFEIQRLLGTKEKMSEVDKKVPVTAHISQSPFPNKRRGDDSNEIRVKILRTYVHVN